MTEKVRITQEQATAIEYLRDTKFHDEGIIASHAKRPMGWEANYTESLNGLPLLTLVDALRIGFEVEEEYKVGDWKKVVLPNGKWAIGQIDTLAFDDILFNYLDENTEWQRVRQPGKASVNPTPEEIKAEQERRVWEKIGRKPEEFRKGDAYEYNNGQIFTVDVYGRIETVRAAYRTGQLKGFYPAESFISFKEGESDD
jgi:hypothetical protein